MNQIKAASPSPCHSWYTSWPFPTYSTRASSLCLPKMTLHLETFHLYSPSHLCHSASFSGFSISWVSYTSAYTKMGREPCALLASLPPPTREFKQSIIYSLLIHWGRAVHTAHFLRKVIFSYSSVDCHVSTHWYFETVIGTKKVNQWLRLQWAFQY